MELVYKPIEGLQIDRRTGGSIQRSGIGDANFLQLRAVSQGTIPNAETLAEASGSGGPNGVIDIKDVIAVGVFVDFVIGSLTSADVIPEFSNKDVDGLGPVDWYRLAAGALSAGVVTPTNVVYRYAASSKKNVIVIPNPGANYMRILTASVGTVTSSSMRIDVIRHWGLPKMTGIA